MNFIVDATIETTGNIFDAVSASVSEHIYNATSKITAKLNTVAGLAVAGVSLAGFEIIDT